MLINLGATADGTTHLWEALGCCSAVLIAIGTPASMIAGACFFGLSITLDLVDGQIARIRGTSGASGRYLDRPFHSMIIPLLAAGMVVASAESGASNWVLVAGLVLIVATSVSVGQSGIADSVNRAPTTVDGANLGDTKRTTPRWMRLVLKSVGSRPTVLSFVLASLVPISVFGVGLGDWVLVGYAMQYIIAVGVPARRTLKGCLARDLKYFITPR